MFKKFESMFGKFEKLMDEVGEDSESLSKEAFSIKRKVVNGAETITIDGVEYVRKKKPTKSDKAN